MPYDPTRDPFAEGGLVTAQGSRCYRLDAGMIGAKELPVYAKALDLFVPEGVVAEVTAVYRGDADTAAVTKRFPAGRHLWPALLRRVTAVAGAGVEIHVEAG